jgi:hypothetical protein
MTTETSYYVRRCGNVQGPWSLEKLKSEVGVHRLGRHHSLSTNGDNWVRADSVEGLFVNVPVREPRDEKRGRESGDRKGSAKSAIASGESPGGPQEHSTTAVTEEYCYIHLAGNVVGPLSLGEVVERIRAGQVSLTDPVHRSGEWRYAQDDHDIMSMLGGEAVRQPSSATVQEATVQASHTDIFAIAATATGTTSLLVSWIPFAGFLGLFPIVLGIVSLIRIRRSSGELSGNLYAIAGLMIGIVSIVAGVVFTALAGWLLFWNQEAPI